MRLLLDTHVFLWFISASPRLPPGMRDAIRDTDNDTFLSVAAVWEAIVKHQLGKLPLPQPPQTYLPLQRDLHQIRSLPLDESSVTRLAGLPALHKDPFDRVMVCQALHLGLTMVTVDPAVRAYPISLLPMA